MRFAPKHERERSRHEASDGARPERNYEAIDGYFPPQSDAQQLKQRNEREDCDGNC